MDPPDDVNVVVTGAAGALPLTLTTDPSGRLSVDKLYHTTMRYPGHVGLIPQTVGEDALPLTALIVAEHQLPAGVVLGVRPIGVLYVSGPGGDEMTVLSVPAARHTAFYSAIVNYKDLPQSQLRTIANFFLHYRDVEDVTRPRTSGWGDVSEAHRVVSEAAARATQS